MTPLPEPHPSGSQKPEARIQDRVIEVSAGLIFRHGRLLITQRREGDHLGGLWEFPGGKRRSGETFEQCLARELREELGAEVVVGELVESITHAYPERVVHLQFHRCRLAAGQEPRALGCAALRWIGLEDLATCEFPPADARLLARLRATPELWRDD